MIPVFSSVSCIYRISLFTNRLPFYVLSLFPGDNFYFTIDHQNGHHASGLLRLSLTLFCVRLMDFFFLLPISSLLFLLNLLTFNPAPVTLASLLQRGAPHLRRDHPNHAVPVSGRAEGRLRLPPVQQLHVS